MFDEFCDLDQECEELDLSLTKLQEELEAEIASELGWWQCQRQMNEDPIASQVRVTMKHTQRKNSRTSSHEDKVEMEDITSKCKVVNYVDKKTGSGTQISSR